MLSARFWEKLLAEENRPAANAEKDHGAKQFPKNWQLRLVSDAEHSLE
ncbi:MAG: hypothetical protein ACUVQR_08035 [Thermogutta sp.]